MKITYQVNPRTSPWELDLVMMHRDGRQRVLRGLVDFLDPNTIVVGFAEGSSASRPKSLDEISQYQKQKLTRVAE